MKEEFSLTFSLAKEVEPWCDGVQGRLLQPQFQTADGKIDSMIIGLTVDVSELVSSAFMPGEYCIFNCSCGVPECRGFDGIIVVHSQFSNTVEWKVPVPIAISDTESVKNVRLYRSVRAGTINGYRKAILRGVKKAAALTAKSAMPVFLKPMWQDIPNLFARAQQLEEARKMLHKNLDVSGDTVIDCWGQERKCTRVAVI